ncbi:MAG: hemolysin III family protein [Alphaproteobacteria bacterium]|nr:hemolysin III family protein [Alphaproteobacteria bacterium]
MRVSSARLYSRAESIADAVVHAGGVAFALVGSLWLLAHARSAGVVAGLSVYCAGLVAMTSFSAAYNLVAVARPAKQILRRLDHSAIFIMIAATYTPFAAYRLPGAQGAWILAAVWSAAAAGVALKLVFPRRFEGASIALYLAMGWMILAVIRPLSQTVAPASLWLLLAGGLVYSAGVAFYALERIPGHKAIWHAAVLLAAVLHYIAIAGEFAR